MSKKPEVIYTTAQRPNAAITEPSISSSPLIKGILILSCGRSANPNSCTMRSRSFSDLVSGKITTRIPKGASGKRAAGILFVATGPVQRARHHERCTRSAHAPPIRPPCVPSCNQRRPPCGLTSEPSLLSSLLLLSTRAIWRPETARLCRGAGEWGRGGGPPAPC